MLEEHMKMKIRGHLWWILWIDILGLVWGANDEDDVPM